MAVQYETVKLDLVLNIMVQAANYPPESILANLAFRMEAWPYKPHVTFIKALGFLATDPPMAQLPWR